MLFLTKKQLITIFTGKSLKYIFFTIHYTQYTIQYKPSLCFTNKEVRFTELLQSTSRRRKQPTNQQIAPCLLLWRNMYVNNSFFTTCKNWKCWMCNKEKKIIMETPVLYTLWWFHFMDFWSSKVINYNVKYENVIR